MENDFLKKSPENWVCNANEDNGFQRFALSICKQCELLEINLSSAYDKPLGEGEENLHLMHVMDEDYMKRPEEGVLRAQYHLLKQ